MFHETYTYFNNEDNRKAEDHADPLNLKKCIRLYPHDDNQGGFFVAVFRKLATSDDTHFNDPTLTVNPWTNSKVR